MFNDFFGLSATPFRLAPDPNFFYESACHKRGLAYLRYGLQQSQGFVVVTGIPGTGKSLLVQMLFSELASGRRMVIAALNNPNLCERDILRAVANCFDIHYPDDNKAGLLGAIERFLVNQRRQGKHVLLIVDEAQNLPKKSLEELRMLTNFQSNENALMQIMLLGQQQLQKMLADPSMEQLTQRVIATCRLTPLSAVDTRAYIEHRLRCVGWQGRPSFSGDALKLIHHHSRGIPRLINNLCDRLLLAACIEEKDHIDEAHLDMVIKELHEESGGAWSETGSPAMIELPPLPDGKFIPSSPIAHKNQYAVASSEKNTDQHSRNAEAASTSLAESSLQSTPDVMQEERVVTPCYERVDDESGRKKKGFLGFGGSNDGAPGGDPAKLLEEVSFKIEPKLNVSDTEKNAFSAGVGPQQALDNETAEDVVTPCYDSPEDERLIEKKGFLGLGRKAKNPSEDRDSSLLNGPQSEIDGDASAANLDPDPFNPCPVEFERAKKGRWWLMPAVAGVVVVAGMALFVIYAEEEARAFVQKMLPSSVSLPQSFSATLPQKTTQEEGGNDELTVPASAVEQVPDEPQTQQKSPLPPISNQRQIQAAAAPYISAVDRPVAVNDVVALVPTNDRLAGVTRDISVSAEADLSLPPPAVVEAKNAVAGGGLSPVPQSIYEYELPDLIYSFTFAYENGDLERFVGLFSADAFLDESYGKQKISRDYKEIFQATDMRDMDIKNVAWLPEGEKATGDGLFELTVWRHGNAVPSHVKGKINIEVVKEKERLYIKRLSLVAE